MKIQFDHTTLPQRVLFGTGQAMENIGAAVESAGAQKVLLINGTSSDALGTEVAERLPVAARIREIVQHVPAQTAADAVQVARDAQADLMVSVGGGSAVGLAKMVARETGLPIVAVPTTFSGSEATDVWGVTQDGRKTTGSDPRVLPQAVVYDAELFASLPPAVAMSSGVNALAHAVDGLWAPLADPINRALGSEGMRSLVPGLLALADDAEDIRAVEQAVYGAYLAAVAFASAGSGLHHKICHVLGGTFSMPHAQTHAVMIGHVAVFNAAHAPEASRRICDSLGAPSVGAGFTHLQETLALPTSLRELGLEEEAIPTAAEIILPAVPDSNPRGVTRRDLEELLYDAWSGAKLGRTTPPPIPAKEQP